jgi:hypothetical protein
MAIVEIYKNAAKFLMHELQINRQCFSIISNKGFISLMKQGTDLIYTSQKISLFLYSFLCISLYRFIHHAHENKILNLSSKDVEILAINSTLELKFIHITMGEVSRIMIFFGFCKFYSGLFIDRKYYYLTFKKWTISLTQTTDSLYLTIIPIFLCESTAVRSSAYCNLC